MKEKITIEEIDKLANLSKLSFTDEEKQVLLTQVNDIIDMLKECENVNTDNVSTVRSQKLRDLRDDIAHEEMDIEDAMKNSPESKSGYFVVPKVVD